MVYKRMNRAKHLEDVILHGYVYESTNWHDELIHAGWIRGDKKMSYKERMLALKTVRIVKGNMHGVWDVGRLYYFDKTA